MRVTVSLVLGSLLVAPAAHAGDLSLNVELPRINAAEYHRPYVAVWVEGADGKAAGAALVDAALVDNGGDSSPAPYKRLENRPDFSPALNSPRRTAKMTIQSMAMRMSPPIGARRAIRADPTRTSASTYQRLDIA